MSAFSSEAAQPGEREGFPKMSDRPFCPAAPNLGVRTAGREISLRGHKMTNKVGKT